MRINELAKVLLKITAKQSAKSASYVFPEEKWRKRACMFKYIQIVLITFMQEDSIKF